MKGTVLCMALDNKKIPVIAVVGPTASGKTALAVEAAKRFNGQIISADSMQIYEDMDIATAKPTADEMQGIPHHLIGFQPVDKKFSVADFVRLAAEKISAVYADGCLPVVAGGTGLYVDSLLQSISFTEEENNGELRRELNALFDEKGGEYMLSVLRNIDPETADALHPNDRGRIIRAIEIFRLTGKTMSEQRVLSREGESLYRPFYIGLNYRDRQTLYDRINLRVDKMLSDGLLEEAGRFVHTDSDTTACQAIGYKELLPYFNGEKELSECVENLKMSTRRYAKRQLSWFRRNESIHWLYPDDYDSRDELTEAACRLIENYLEECK